jgi:hypothetical protein
VIDQPDLRPFLDEAGRDMYCLYRTYDYRWAFLGEELRLTVPEGFESDGASVPRLLWSLTGIERDGVHRAAALLHDFLYKHAGEIPYGAQMILIGEEWSPYGSGWTRKDADKLFARVLRESGVGKVRRRLMYLGVRLGGWRPWGKVQREMLQRKREFRGRRS